MRSLAILCIAVAFLPGVAMAQQMKPGKGGAGGSGVLRESGGSRTPGDNSTPRGDGQRANNKQSGQQQGGQQQGGQQQGGSKQ